MQGIYSKHDGQDYEVNKDETLLTLLAELKSCQIMLQTIKANEFVWINPGEDPDLVECFYILGGEIMLEQEGETLHLLKDDFFRVEFLDIPVIMKCLVPVQLLYITTKPLYENLDAYVNKLDDLISRVDEKDNYTRRHSQNVLEYSIAISKKMNCSQKILENLAIAALFHDVGKCFVPDEILKKAGKLTPEERKSIFKHPINSKKLIEPQFGSVIANIALSHHERLDGSGYPLGLSANDIPIEARIIAVADSFDAMTSIRPYGSPKSYHDAIAELSGMTKQYDSEVVTALCSIVENHEIRPEVLS